MEAIYRSFCVWKDEIKDHKKSAIDKILQCNNLLGLDVMAYDSSYNLLDPLKASTIYLFNELKKNSLVKANVINKSVFHPSFASLNEEVYTQFSDVNTTFSHQLSNTNLMMQNGGSVCVRTNSITSRTSINQNQYRLSQSVFYIKLSIENIRPSENVSIDENVQFYVNLFMNKEGCYLRWVPLTTTNLALGLFLLFCFESVLNWIPCVQKKLFLVIRQSRASSGQDLYLKKKV